MGTNCASLLADLFLHDYQADFLQGHLKNKERKLSQTFNSSFHYIEEVLSLNNSRFDNYLHLIYPNKLEVKDTADTQRSASNHGIYIEIDNGWRSKTKLCDKRDYFTFPIVNFPFISSYIPASLAYSTRSSRNCAQYSDFLDRTQLLTQEKLKQGYVAPRLKSSLQTFYSSHHNLVDHYKISISQITMDLLLFT